MDQGSNFLTIPAALAADRDLSAAAKLLAAARHTLGPSATPRELARAAGLAAADLEPALAELRRRGL